MDNGIELIVPLDVYRNGDLIEFVNNPDGTVSIMLKISKKLVINYKENRWSLANGFLYFNFSKAFQGLLFLSLHSS